MAGGGGEVVKERVGSMERVTWKHTLCVLVANISNILLILGSSAVVYHRLPGGPGGLSFGGMTIADLGILILSSLLLWSSSYTGKRDSVDRADGLIFLACFAGYMAILFNQL